MKLGTADACLMGIYVSIGPGGADMEKNMFPHL